MSQPAVSIVRTGVANVASVCAACTRLGYEPRLINSAPEVQQAEYLILPGVGTFGAGMEALRATDLVEPLRDRIIANRPTLAICLGMQLLCSASQESPGVEGVGILECQARRFNAPALRVPQFGWNTVVAESGTRVLTTGKAYFANSYYIESPPPGWRSAITTYGSSFVSAIERGNIVACQFHPELSGQFGSELMQRWLATTKEVSSCSPAV